MSGRIRTSGRSGPPARRTPIWHVPELPSRSIGECNWLGPMCSSPSCPALPALKRGHGGVERDVNDPPERQPARHCAHVRAHAAPGLADGSGGSVRWRRGERGTAIRAVPTASGPMTIRWNLLRLDMRNLLINNVVLTCCY